MDKDIRKTTLTEELKSILKLINYNDRDNDIALKTCNVLKLSLEKLFSNFFNFKNDVVLTSDHSIKVPQIRLEDLHKFCAQNNFSLEVVAMLLEAIEEICLTRKYLHKSLYDSLSTKDKLLVKNDPLSKALSLRAIDYLILEEILKG